MRISGRLLPLLALTLCLLAPVAHAPVAHAETLPLPGNLTDLNSGEGERYFLESGALATYFRSPTIS